MEGRSHSRSCIYRIYKDDNGDDDRQVDGDTGTDDTSALASRNTPGPLEAASPRVTENTVGNRHVGTHTCEDDGSCIGSIKEGVRAASFSRPDSTVQGGFDTKRNKKCVVESHRDARGDGEDGIEHKEQNLQVKVRPVGRGVGLESAQRIEAGMREAGRVAGMMQCKMTARAEAALFQPSTMAHVSGERKDRRDSARMRIDSQGVDAPPELLEIVPKVVEVVRRCVFFMCKYVFLGHNFEIYDEGAD